MSRFFPGQRVRIKRGIAVQPDLAHLMGQVVHIDRPMSAADMVREYGFLGLSAELRYWLDVKVADETVIAAESALEPVFDQPEKISWQHSAVVWRPQFMDAPPAVIRRNRVRV